MTVFRVKSRSSGRAIRIEGATLSAEGSWLSIKAADKTTIAIFEAGAVEYAIDETAGQVDDT
ncbi:MAG: hypothetical protein JJE47_16395 [Acidimicrobiia bacterium]|nr:hypothetical protein [Acidimicrobiia bacterium]